jgi:hypothetical protein
MGLDCRPGVGLFGYFATRSFFARSGMWTAMWTAPAAPGAQPEHVPELAAGALVAVGREVAARRAGLVAGDVDVEAALLGPVVAAAQVPFADVSRGVTGRPEDLGQGGRLARQVLEELGAQHLLVGPVGPAGQPVGQVQSGRHLARHQGRPRRRTDGAGGVAVGEAQSRGGQAVQVGRPVERAAVTAQVGPAEVVGQDQHDVVLARRLGCVGRGER